MRIDAYRNGLIILSNPPYQVRDLRTGALYESAVVRSGEREYFEDAEIPADSEEAPVSGPAPAPEPSAEDAEIAALEARLAQLKSNR